MAGRIAVECVLRVTADTIEEALTKMAEKIDAERLGEDKRDMIARKYYFWNEENDYVDWEPPNTHLRIRNDL